MPYFTNCLFNVAFHPQATTLSIFNSPIIAAANQIADTAMQSP